MKFCKNCGAQMVDEAVVCQACGYAVQEPVTPVYTQPGAAPQQPNMNPQGYVQPNMQQPNMGQANMQQPNMGQPNMQQPNMGQPNMQQPNMGQPNMQQPYMNQPNMQQPNMQQPYMNQQGYSQPGMNQAYGQPGAYGYPNPQQQANKKKLGILVGAIAVVAVLLVVILVIKPFGNKYSDPIKQYVKGMQNQSVETMLKGYPKPVRDEFREEMIGYYTDEDEFWDYAMQSFEYMVGSNIEFSYEITDRYKMDADEIEELEEALEEYYDYKCNINAAYELLVELTLEGDDDSYTVDEDFIVIKIGNTWYTLGEG